jgi:hypothetical protein
MADRDRTPQPDNHPRPAAANSGISGWRRVTWAIAEALCGTVADRTRRAFEADGVRAYHGALATKATTVVADLVRDGWWLGAPPYGYRPDTVAAVGGFPGRHRLVVDAERAAIVPLIFTWHVVFGRGANAIATRLASDPDAYPRPVDHATGRTRPWTTAQVETILASPAYLGHAVRGRTRHGRHVHPQWWTWSTHPSHPDLVQPDMFWATYRAAHPDEYGDIPADHGPDTVTGAAA